MTLFTIALLGCSTPTPARAETTVEVGALAPDFSLPALDGKQVKLSDQRGSVVVLEWFNPGCPFVVAAHEGGPLETMAAQLGDKVTWLAINSGSHGKQGFGLEVNQDAASRWKLQHPILLDETGTVGKQYGATNTPQMVVIDTEGKIAYWGALDNAPLGKPKGGKPVPYTANAIEAVLAHKEPVPSKTQPWGCSVKY